LNITYFIEKQEPSATVLAITLIYITSLILNSKISTKNSLSQFQQDVMKKILGVLLFTLIPVLMIHFSYKQRLAEYGVGLPVKIYFFLISLGLYFATFPFLLLYSKTDEGEKKFKNSFGKNETLRHTFSRAVCWIIYIGGYEFSFRGFLLFSLYKTWGSVPAIVISTAIYSLTHTNKGIGETAGSLIIGFVFGSIALSSRSFIPSFLTHVLIALTIDIILSIKYGNKRN